MCKKAVIEIGWQKFVLDKDKAIQALELLSEAERYEEIRNREEGEVVVSYHVYQHKYKEYVRLTMLPDDMYRMAKLAGKPEGKD